MCCLKQDNNEEDFWLCSTSIQINGKLKCLVSSKKDAEMFKKGTR